MAVFPGMPDLFKQTFLFGVCPSLGLGPDWARVRFFLDPLLEQLLLPGCQVPGNGHLHLHQQVSPAGAFGVGDSIAFEANRLTGLRAGRYDYLPGAGEQGNGHPGAQTRLGKGDGHPEMQVVALPAEQVMGPHLEDNI